MFPKGYTARMIADLTGLGLTTIYRAYQGGGSKRTARKIEEATKGKTKAVVLLGLSKRKSIA